MKFLKNNEIKSIGKFISMLTFFIINFSTLIQADLFRFQANAPLNKFLYPMFNSYGQKIWICQGDRVKYLSEEKIKMEKMCITFFSPENLSKIDMIIRSDKAIISLPNQQAQGKTLLTITNPTYTIIGENWQWTGKQAENTFSRVHIGKNATVMFYD